MGHYLVELYRSRSTGEPLVEAGERARVAADELAREGTRVRYVRSIFVAEDEICLCLYEADSAEAAARAASKAGLAPVRVVPAIADDPTFPHTGRSSGFVEGR